MSCYSHTYVHALLDEPIKPTVFAATAAAQFYYTDRAMMP
jgi:hypothetical protein